jgi:hypothetical protein
MDNNSPYDSRYLAEHLTYVAFNETDCLPEEVVRIIRGCLVGCVFHMFEAALAEQLSRLDDVLTRRYGTWDNGAWHE